MTRGIERTFPRPFSETFRISKNEDFNGPYLENQNEFLKNSFETVFRASKSCDRDQLVSAFQLTFKVEVEDGDVIRVDTIDKAFNSQMMEVFKGSDLNEIIEEMFAHIRRKSKSGVGEQPICVRSSPVSDVNFHQLNLTRGSSYLSLPDWVASKKTVINPRNLENEECFKWAVLVALHDEGIGNNPHQVNVET